MTDAIIENEEENAETPKTGEEGFTLVEVMVTLVIITILITAVAINIVPLIGKGSQTKAKSDIASLEQALELYYLDMFEYPSQTDGLEALVKAPAGINEARYQRNGYIKQLPTDPWNNPYQYRYPGEYGVIDIFSYGSDGEPGGEDDAADITNWEE